MTTIQASISASTTRVAATRSRRDTIDLSIIIVSWNVRDHLRACLESIRADQGSLRLEVIVVDNHSSDGSAAMVERDYSWVKLVSRDENLGFARANNLGMAQATGRYLLLLNPDTEVHAGCLKDTLGYAECHPSLGVVGCRSYRPDGSQQSTMFCSLRVRDVLLNVLVPNRLMRRIPWVGRARYVGADFDQPHTVEVIAGCFMLVRRETFEQVGGMDASFFMYGEEAEWCHRIRRGGWKVGYFPGASFLHHGGVSTEQCSDEMNLAMARSQLLLLRRTRGPWAAYMANALMLLRDGPRALLWSVLGNTRSRQENSRRSMLKRSAARFGLHVRGLFSVEYGQ